MGWHALDIKDYISGGKWGGGFKHPANQHCRKCAKMHAKRCAKRNMNGKHEVQLEVHQ